MAVIEKGKTGIDPGAAAFPVPLSPGGPAESQNGVHSTGEANSLADGRLPRVATVPKVDPELIAVLTQLKQMKSKRRMTAASHDTDEERDERLRGMYGHGTGS